MVTKRVKIDTYMKKMISFLAFAAVILGVASCDNTNNNDVKLNRFKITVDNITVSKAHIVITPPDEQMYYTYCLFNEATFNWFKSKPDGLQSALKVWEPEQGIDDYVYNLFPDTKYVMCVCEKDKENDVMVGEVEYIRFQTLGGLQPKLPEDLVDEGTSLPMTGECWFALDMDGIIVIDGKYPIPDSQDESLYTVLYFISDKLTGHFTTDDLYSYLFAFSYTDIKDSEGHNAGEGLSVCAADITGTYNEDTKKYTYEGWCEYYSKDDGLLRLPLSFECTEWIPKD